MTKRRIYIVIGLLCIMIKEGYSQLSYDSIKKEFVEETVSYLASNNLKGRVNYSREQLEVAEYLGKQFANFGLSPFPGISSFHIPFRNSVSTDRGEKLEWNHTKLPDSLYMFFPSSLLPSSSKLDQYMVLKADYP